jgi:hypothetical protein
MDTRLLADSAGCCFAPDDIFRKGIVGGFRPGPNGTDE